MIIKPFRALSTLTLSLGLTAAFAALPAFATPVDLFPLAQPTATGPADVPGAAFEIARRERESGGGRRRRGRGADDGSNHSWMQDSGDDLLFARRGRGADDHRGGGRRRGRGSDDGPNHS